MTLISQLPREKNQLLFVIIKVRNGWRDRSADLGVMNPLPQISLTQQTKTVAVAEVFREFYTLLDEV